MSCVESGIAGDAERLLPLVYDELRKLAAQKLLKERPDQTLQATALVHEAYLRLVSGDCEQKWDSRGHFFAAAAVAMRRILVEAARKKGSRRRGGRRQRLDLRDDDVSVGPVSDALLDLDAALDELASVDRQAAELVNLRLFAGMTVAEVAQHQDIPLRTAHRNWAYARAWLGCRLSAVRD